MAVHVKQDRNWVDLTEFQTEYLRNDNSIEMDVDGTTPVQFTYVVPNDFYFMAHRVCFFILDVGGVNADQFGGITGGLTNGCLLEVVRNNAVAKDLFGGTPIKTNGDFSALGGVDVATLAGGKGVGIRWTFAKAAGFPLRLHSGDIFRLTVRDNLTALNRFRTMLHGFTAPTSVIDKKE